MAFGENIAGNVEAGMNTGGRFSGIGESLKNLNAMMFKKAEEEGKNNQNLQLLGMMYPQLFAGMGESGSNPSIGTGTPIAGAAGSLEESVGPQTPGVAGAGVINPNILAPKGFQINPNFGFGSKSPFIKVQASTDISGEIKNNGLDYLPPDQARLALEKKDPTYVALLDKYAQGQYKFSGRSPRQMMALQEDLSYLYPGLDQSKVEARWKLRSDFTSGKTAAKIKGYNTLLGHLESLYNSIDKLGNTSIEPWNKYVGQPLATMTGINPNIKKTITYINAATGEAANTFKQTGATDTEIKHMLESLHVADSPQNLKASTEALMELLGSRLSSEDYNWRTAFDLPTDEPYPILSPKSERILKKYAPGSFEFRPMASPNDDEELLNALRSKGINVPAF